MGDFIDARGGVTSTSLQYRFSSEKRCLEEGERLAKKLIAAHTTFTGGRAMAPDTAVIAKASFDCLKSN
jgi:hypothetical protein